jgi:BirA family biotin operon repressor/biotin-[acetyl-CoA-carboxylase] ligase
MNTSSLNTLPISEIRYFGTIGSTNDFAMQWANDGAEDLSLVLADEQTAGRGRMERKWFTPPGSALAMSLILRPTADEASYIPRATALPAISLVDSLRKRGLDSLIKWPNDVLLSGSKVAGILVESIWAGNKPDALILGMGVNVLKASVPATDELLYPTTSIEDELGNPLNREELLKDILIALLAWRHKMGTDSFLTAWQQNLAFFGQQVRIFRGSDQAVIGELIALNSDGSLKLQNEYGRFVTVHFGEVHLRSLA